MSPKALAAALLATAALATHAEAFQMTKKAIRNQGIFGIKVANSDMAFYGRADAVLSISFQEYTTGSFIVAEVVIDMKDSNQQFRIYNARPLSAAEIAARTNKASAANSQNRGLDPNSATKLPIPLQAGLIESKINNVINHIFGIFL
jgi:cell division septum initiation protein DivIVA